MLQNDNYWAVVVGQVGMEYKNKFGCGKNTGLQQSSTLFFPYQIFIQVAKLVKGYGGDFIAKRDNKGVLIDLVVNITSEEATKMVWDPRRLCGSNYLVKRKFKKLCLDGKNKMSTYDGHAGLVVTKQALVTIKYNMKSQTCSMFYIQRCNYLVEWRDIILMKRYFLRAQL